MSTLVVPARFCGPPTSGNGGWTAGALATHVDAEVVQVSLRRPPPLDIPMPVSAGDGSAEATHEGEVVVTATSVSEVPTPVAPVEVEVARGLTIPAEVVHGFPTCFVCGPDREPGDGLRILPGPVDDGRWATTWVPHDDHATTPVTWAAVDCPSGWAAGFAGTPMVLASMTAVVHALPRPGEEHVVVGERRASEGRKTWTAATLRSSDGTILATAEHLWVALRTPTGS